MNFKSLIFATENKEETFDFYLCDLCDLGG